MTEWSEVTGITYAARRKSDLTTYTVRLEEEEEEYEGGRGERRRNDITRKRKKRRVLR